MSSNVFPILSSTPPPLDDGPMFDDEWSARDDEDEDDFGGFAAFPSIPSTKAAPSSGEKISSASINSPNNNSAGIDPACYDNSEHVQGVNSSQNQTSLVNNINDMRTGNSFAPDFCNDDDDDDFDDWAEFSSAVVPPRDVISENHPSVNNTDSIHSSSEQHPPVSALGTIPNHGSVDHSDCTDSHSQSTSLTTQENIDKASDVKSLPGNSSEPQNCEDDTNPNVGQLDPNVGQLESDVSDSQQHQSHCGLSNFGHDTQDNTSQESITDSGMCSDISPVPKFEDYPEFEEYKNNNNEDQSAQIASEIPESDNQSAQVASESPKSDDSSDQVSSKLPESADVHREKSQLNTSSALDNTGAEMCTQSDDIITSDSSEKDCYRNSENVTSDNTAYPVSSESNLHSQMSASCSEAITQSNPVDVCNETQTSGDDVTNMSKELEFRKPSICEDDIVEEEAEDFADFAMVTAKDDDDDFGEFPATTDLGETAFSSAETTSSPDTVSVVSNNEVDATTPTSETQKADQNDDEDDDFGDFNTCNDDFTSFKEVAAVTSEGDDGWGAFSDAGAVVGDDKASDEWATFQDAAQPPTQVN